MKPFLSIIIPVYNGLQHNLPKCLSSIKEQSLAKELYEVICVDDCSTDKTRQWLREQQNINVNFQIVENQVNIRQGGGRNEGVKVALGEYIMFIDQDDYYHKESLREVYEYLKKTPLDVLVCDSIYQFRDIETNKLQLNLKHCEIMSGEQFIQKNGWVGAPWRMILNRAFYNRNTITFVENRRIEDVDWSCKVLYYTQKIQYQPILLVHYIKGNYSTTDTMYKNKETLKDNIEAGNRTLLIAKTLYANSKVQANIISVADMYYNYSCKYMFGLLCSQKNKISLIRLIAIENSNFPFVNFAIGHPYIFSLLSTLSVPLFRFVKKLKTMHKIIKC
jgi:glycosyltransferase involved in cell wall biosynthesis